MKKLFSLLTAVLFAGSMMASVTILPGDFTAAENANYSTTKDGVTVAVTASTVNADQMRIFKGKTITISVAEGNITGIVFTCTAQGDAKYGPGCFAEVEGYTYAANKGTWLGSATSVAFTASSNQVRATKIEVYLDGEVPSGDQGPIKVTVAEAIAAGMALDSMATSEDMYEVTGYVVNSQPYNHQYSNQIWFMADDAANTGAQEFEAYACVVKEDGAVKQVIDGDKVVLTGALSKYWNAKDSKFVIEIKNGVAAFVEKAEGDHDLPVEQVDTLNVVDATAAALQLPDSATSTEKYAVYGYIAKFAKNGEYSSQYKNASFYMTDEVGSTYGDLKCYRASVTPADSALCVAGAYVMVTGNLQNNVYNGNHTAQLVNGKVTFLPAPAIDTILVNVAEALTVAAALDSNAVSKDIYGVRGIVSEVKLEFEDEVESFYMVDALGSADKFFAFKAHLPKAVAVGDEVVLAGKIQNYKDPVQGILIPQIGKGKVIEINGEQQGIEQIVLTEKARKVVVEGQIFIIRDNKLFNLQGARVR